MINPEKYKYTVAVISADKRQYDITSYIENASWDEEEDQLACRISFTVKNDKTSKGRLSSIIKPGCWVGILYSYNGKNGSEAVRGKVVEWNPSAKATEETLKVKAYDVLYDLQESQDHIYYSAGATTKTVITSLLKKWGIKVVGYSGPNIKHGKLLYKSEKLGTAIIKTLKEAKRKGGKEAVLRSVKTDVSVVGYGSNSIVYHFEERQHITEARHRISTSGMVTRVKVIGKSNDDGSAPVEATVDGKTQYGIRQKIYSRGNDESLDEAKKEAKGILSENGVPNEEITIKLPDVPVVRKGDRIHLKVSTISSGYYYVISASHDIDSMSMTLGLKKAPAESTDSGKKANRKKESYSVGDIVMFHGGEHYVSSDASNPASRNLAAGKAKITYTNPGSRHPYCLVTQNWNVTHVWGWVDDGTFD